MARGQNVLTVRCGATAPERLPGTLGAGSVLHSGCPPWRLRVIESWAWRKSPASTDRDDCVEVVCTGVGVRVRDSKRRGADIVALTPAAWDFFLRALDDPSPARRAVS
ncbi:DUF397 domain-containing protein [Streptomyces sp. NPDC005908]|uniref:DUF397 domain-containing protein n=1 Tax=Streptomyces sp. NPDC005908 TaxID=3157084 RepID=UPI0033F4986A